MVTNDLMKFGFIELEAAADLLKTFKTKNDLTRFLGDQVALWFNANSGNVFLCDSDYNTAMLNSDGKLEDFITCPDCGNEGLFSEFEEKKPCCTEFKESL